jgi:hypothetical protein
LVSRIVAEADELITERLSDMIEPSEVHPLALPVELELNRSIS